jgi:hypothetical protein
LIHGLFSRAWINLGQSGLPNFDIIANEADDFRRDFRIAINIQGRGVRNMSDTNSDSGKGLVATSGVWDGLHPGMGLAAKGMVLVFVVFTALNVELANGIYGAIRGWIETVLNWYYISAVTVMLFVCIYLMFTGILHMKASQPKKCASDLHHMQSACI